jgi:flagellar basal body-associated protein FliL
VANGTKHPDESKPAEGQTESSANSKSKYALFRAKALPYALVLLLISTLVIHGIGWAYYKSIKTSAPVEFSPEIGVGKYQFIADKTAGGRVSGAEFSLYVTALEGLDRIARTLLTSHKFRVQEEIESLLRQTHSGDFDDPTLNDLKRQIRERINQALGNRVVSDVIIANLKIAASNNKEPASTADAAPSPPWIEKSTNYVSQQSGN